MYKEAFAVRDIEEAGFDYQSAPRNKILFLLRYAILAPSTHNSQPWRFKLEPLSCKIYFDPAQYTIIHGDPIKRDLYISFGCFIENLVTAASYFGVFDRVMPVCEENTRLVAEVFFKNLGDVAPRNESFAPLISAIKKRVNARGLFEKKKIPEILEKRFRELNASSQIEVLLVSEKEKIHELGVLTARGLRIAYRNKEFREEMSRWMNTSFSKKRDGIPGYSLRMPGLISLIFPRLLRWFDMGKRVGWLNEVSISSAPLVTVIGTNDESPREWLEIGRLAERMMLHAFASGLVTSIFVASIEMGDLWKDVQRIASAKTRPQLLMCVGSMTHVQPPNMRHPVEEKLLQ